MTFRLAAMLALILAGCKEPHDGQKDAAGPKAAETDKLAADNSSHRRGDGNGPGAARTAGVDGDTGKKRDGDDSLRRKGPEPTSPPIPSAFSEVEIDEPYKKYLLAQPVLMEVTGAKILRLTSGNHVVMAVASTVLNDNSAKDRLRAERVCRDKALASVVAEKEGVQVAHVEHLNEKTVIVLDNGKESGNSVSELLQITKTKVEGITKGMPVVGRWKSKEGDVFYLAIGMIVDKKGNPIRDKTQD